MLFANLQLAANSAVLNHLANKQVTIGGAVVPGIFRNLASEAQLGMGVSSSSPVVTVASSAVMVEPVGKQLTIDAVRYEIVDAGPDNTGLTILTLTVAA
jgi:hypothetical protein